MSTNGQCVWNNGLQKILYYIPLKMGNKFSPVNAQLPILRFIDFGATQEKPSKHPDWGDRAESLRNKVSKVFLDRILEKRERKT